jgi:hypothetical protein
MKDENRTVVVDRVDTWDWTASARAIFGVFDFIPDSVSDSNGGYVHRFRARSSSHSPQTSIDLECRHR